MDTDNYAYTHIPKAISCPIAVHFHFILFFIFFGRLTRQANHVHYTPYGYICKHRHINYCRYMYADIDILITVSSHETHFANCTVRHFGSKNQKKRTPSTNIYWKIKHIDWNIAVKNGTTLSYGSECHLSPFILLDDFSFVFAWIAVRQYIADCIEFVSITVKLECLNFIKSYRERLTKTTAYRASTHCDLINEQRQQRYLSL